MSADVASSLPVPGPGAAAPEQDGSSSNGGAADVEAASQGKVKGIIVPPPEIRAIADKTARFVAKNGKSFEQRILNSEEGRSAKFNFMRPHDPYYAYYEYKIREVEEGRDTPAGAPAAPAPAAAAPAAAAADGEAKEPGKATAAAAVQKKAVMAPIAKAARTIAKDVKPPPFVFSHGHPTGLTAHDLDLIKLTAQYTAAGGRQFLATLARKEAQNEMFQFLKGTHALFSYFTSLVDAYTKVLQPTEQQKAAAKAGCSRQVMLERAVHRWEYDRAEQEKRRAQEAEMDADKLAFRSIDWQDFVVVETIDFPEDELTGVTYGTMDEEQDVEMDMDEEDVSGFRVDQLRQEHAARTEVDVDMDMEMEEEDPEEGEGEGDRGAPPLPDDAELLAERRRQREAEEASIRVVEDYQPAVASAAAGALPQTVVDPISGRAIPLSQLSEHMRIQLMDPRWREQQAVALSRQRETALAEGDSIARNLQAFARKRGDIFGSAEEEEAQMAVEAAERARRMEEANRIIFNDRSAAMAAAPSAAMAPPAPTRSWQQQQQQLPPPPARPTAAAAAQPPPPPPRPTPAAQLLPPPPPPRPSQPQAAAAVLPPPPPPLRDEQLVPPPPPPLPAKRASAEAALPPPPAAAAAAGGAIPGMAHSEEEFAALHPGPVTIRVQCPADDQGEAAAWSLTGQVVPVTLSAGVRATVKELKDGLSAALGGAMPANKQQLREGARGFLRDAATLAAYNLGGGAVVDLVPRKRGGR